MGHWWSTPLTPQERRLRAMKRLRELPPPSCPGEIQFGAVRSINDVPPEEFMYLFPFTLTVAIVNAIEDRYLVLARTKRDDRAYSLEDGSIRGDASNLIRLNEEIASTPEQLAEQVRSRDYEQELIDRYNFYQRVYRPPKKRKVAYCDTFGTGEIIVE